MDHPKYSQLCIFVLCLRLPYFKTGFWIPTPLSILLALKLAVIFGESSRTARTFFLKLNCIICFTLLHTRKEVYPSPNKIIWLPKQSNHFSWLHTPKRNFWGIHESLGPCNPFWYPWNSWKSWFCLHRKHWKQSQSLQFWRWSNPKIRKLKYFTVWDPCGQCSYSVDTRLRCKFGWKGF